MYINTILPRTKFQYNHTIAIKKKTKKTSSAPPDRYPVFTWRSGVYANATHWTWSPTHLGSVAALVDVHWWGLAHVGSRIQCRRVRLCNCPRWWRRARDAKHHGADRARTCVRWNMFFALPGLLGTHNAMFEPGKFTWVLSVLKKGLSRTQVNPATNVAHDTLLAYSSTSGNGVQTHIPGEKDQCCSKWSCRLRSNKLWSTQPLFGIICTTSISKAALKSDLSQDKNHYMHITIDSSHLMFRCCKNASYWGQLKTCFSWWHISSIIYWSIICPESRQGSKTNHRINGSLLI